MGPRKRWIVALAAAALALLAGLAWRLAAGGAEPVELAGTPRVERWRLRSDRELVAPPAPAEEARPEEEPDAPTAGGAPATTAAGAARRPDPRAPEPERAPPPSRPARPATTEDRGVEVTGLVLAAGDPLGGACVRVAPADGDGTFRAATRADAAGRYALRLPRGGRWAFEVERLVRPDEVAPVLETSLAQHIREARAGETLRATLVVDVPAVRAFVQDLAFGLATIAGTVRIPGIAEHSTSGPFPMALVEVHLHDAGGRRVSTTVSGKEGRYEHAVLTPGTYGVRSGLFDRRWGSGAPGHAWSRLLEVRAGESYDASLDLERRTRLSGFVRWPDGTPVERWSLYLARADGHAAWAEWWGLREGGRFDLWGYPPGELILRMSGWGPDRGPGAARSDPIDLRVDEPLSVELVLETPSVHVGLRLDGIDWRDVWWCDEHGFPLPIAPIWSRTKGAPLSSWERHVIPPEGVPPDGLGGHLLPGTYLVRWRVGCVERERAIQVTDEGPQEFRIGG